MTVEQILTEIYKSDCADEVFLALSKRVIREKAELNKQIAKAPTVEERPQGEWIEGTQGYYCSECETIDRFYFEHNFCPNCGASMSKGGAE